MLLLTVGVSGNMVKVFHFTIGPTMNFIALLKPRPLGVVRSIGFASSLRDL